MEIEVHSTDERMTMLQAGLIALKHLSLVVAIHHIFMLRPPLS